MSDTTAVSTTTPAAAAVPTRRLMSLDALRGFDMFWIVGGEELVHGLHKAWPVGPVGLLERQVGHKPWQGVAFYDMIFPLFVFIVGASLVFSVTRLIERGGKAASLKRIFIRSLMLYLFGLLVYGGLSKGFDHIRWMGVLQRIAISYFFASLIFSTFRLRGMIVICASLLLGYWALCTLVPIRDFNLETRRLQSLNLKPESPETMARFLATTNWVRGKFDDGLCLPQHLDFRYLPGFKWDGAYDPEGILSTLPAIATCLLGVFAGLLLKNGSMPDEKKVLVLLGAGIAVIAVGFIWGLQFPVIKKIWTSSYVLVVGGYSCVFLAVFYQMIEIWQWRRWCEPFLWIGMNPITIYMVCNLVHVEDLAKLVVGGPVQHSLGAWGPLAVAVVVMGLVLVFTRFLYQRKIFLRL